LPLLLYTVEVRVREDVCLKSGVLGLTHPTTFTRVTKRTPRGPAVEQGNVSGNRKSRSSCYWYARRIRLRTLCRGVKPRNKGPVVDDKDDPSPPINLHKVDRESQATAALRFGTKLLRKRRTYEKVFNKALSSGCIDHALRRIQTRRCFELKCTKTPVMVCSGDTNTRSYSAVGASYLSFSMELVDKPQLKECGRKEKEKLRKYALAVRSRLAKRLTKLKKFEGTSEQRAKKRYAEARRKANLESRSALLRDEASKRERYRGGIAPPPSLTGQSNTGAGVGRGRVLRSTLDQLNANTYKGVPRARPDAHW